jgi:diguanylate cyclase (GGDEF)-like protein
VELISLKRSMDVLERTSLLLERALQCCGETLEAVEEQCARVDPPRMSDSLQILRETHRLLLADPTPELVDETRRLVRRELGRISKLLAQYIEDLQPGFRNAMSSLDDAVQSISQHSQHYDKCLNKTADDIESLGRLRDLGAVHSGISRNVNALRGNLQHMIRQSHDIIVRLEDEKSELQQRLDVVEKEALTDALTGLANRRATERMISGLMEGKRKFCLVLLDLNRFKRINDTHGHTAGDQILRAFAHRLRGMVRDDELVGRWGGDEFVVVLVRSFEEASRRARHFVESLSGEYLVELKSGRFKLCLGLSSGVAEYREGDSTENLVQRSDEVLYADKCSHPV